MSPDNPPTDDISEIRDGDILFDCPHCGKSMAIEAAGAGLMVPCAGCGRAVQIPIPDAGTPEAPVAGAALPRPDDDPREVIRQLDAALGMANQQIDRLMGEKEALQERRAFLEQLRIAHDLRYEQIAAEMAKVQEALDRALEMLKDARSEKPV